MSRLNDLLRQLEAKDPSMAKELRKEYDALADRRAFGLNFERHTPESVELPGRKIRKGDRVHVLPGRGENPTKENSRLWRVTAIDRLAGTATIEDWSVEPAATQEQLLTELVVVAEFRDPIYPGLVSTGRIERGGDKPFHAVINGENYHALQTLLFTHRGQVDCIYIDPPYNTGNEGWIYNDKYVADDDHYKHSKWLAFMERRLRLAQELLKPTGVLIVAIGDDEHHRLRMLLEQVFGEENFLADVVWQGRVKNDRRFTGGGVDYMIMFARSQSALLAADVRWSEKKNGVAELIEVGRRSFEVQVSGGASPAEASSAATRAVKEWLRANKETVSGGVAAYQRVDEQGRVFRGGPLDSPNPRPNLMYPVTHPTTGVSVPTPAKGWRVSETVMTEMIASDQVVWGKDHSVGIQRKLILTDDTVGVPAPTFVADRDTATKALRGILGEQRFPNPKPVDVLARWLKIVTPEDALIVDFFAGSGSTGEATMRLNAAGGAGGRRFLLVTNNEVAQSAAKILRKAGGRPGDEPWEALGVYEYVTKPRILTIVSGKRPDGSKYSDGLEQNVEFFKLTYEAPLRVSSNREFATIAPLLWLKSGGQGRRIDDIESGWDVADTYGVLADLDQTEPFLKALARREADGSEIRMVFVMTDEDRLFASVCRDLPEHVRAVRLYEAYLRNFEIEAGRSTR